MARPKTDVERAFDRMLKEHVAPVLKLHGFRRKGLNWHLRRDAEAKAWGVINVQKSAWGDRNDIRFTLNLGVRADANAKDATRAPSIRRCHESIRIGQLSPQKQDLWWKIAGDARSLDAIVNGFGPLLGELLPLLERNAVPWVKRRLPRIGRRKHKWWIGTIYG